MTEILGSPFQGLLYFLPFIITALLLLFLSLQRGQRRRYEQLKVDLDSSFEYLKESSFDEYLKLLIERDDVTLRVLEEVFAAGGDRFMVFSPNKEARRAISLRRIQSALRVALKDSIKVDNFESLRDRVLKLIDEAQKEIDTVQQRKPFEGLEEPEKSLLVDLLAEIPADKTIPRQKVLQLADIIKIKHQDIRNLQIENTKSATWTRWSTFGTIFFGILSIVLSVYTAFR